MQNKGETVCGYIAIAGRPNVGKSTLLNHILGQKLSITSRKPQTTRHRILGVKTVGVVQTIYVDTPGVHWLENHALNRHLNREAQLALMDVEGVIFVVESLKWTKEDNLVLEMIQEVKKPVILAVNKVDTIEDKTTLLPYLKALSLKFNFFDVIPISAAQNINIDSLEKKIAGFLPKSPHYFPMGQITDRTSRFRIAEIIREKIVRLLGKELPYAVAVEIEQYKNNEEKSLVFIHAIIWVEREGQKPIVIGQNGDRLKKIGIRARIDIEKLLGQKVHLQLWVKVKKRWSDDERALKYLGYHAPL